MAHQTVVLDRGLSSHPASAAAGPTSRALAAALATTAVSAPPTPSRAQTSASTNHRAAAVRRMTHTRPLRNSA